MSVMPIVCDTVAAGLACGNLTLDCCCANARDATPAIVKTESTKMETRLIEIISSLPDCKMCAHYETRDGRRAIGQAVSAGEFTTFYNSENVDKPKETDGILPRFKKFFGLDNLAGDGGSRYDVRRG